MLVKRDRGELDDGFDALLTDAVSGVVRRQAHVGLSVINDGEFSKLSYATYVKERLDGFAGRGEVGEFPDLRDFPEYGKRVMAGLDMHMPLCVEPVRYRDRDAVKRDVARLKASLADADAEEAFMTAASPGVISFFLQNQHYADHEEYIGVLADAMKYEYDEIHAAGLLLQLDCPDLTIARHVYGRAERVMALHIEALNHATRDIPPERMRMHLCWGNYEGPHHHDVPLIDIIDFAFDARPAGICFEAANPRHEHEWRVFGAKPLPSGKVLIPGVLDSTTNYIEHPQLVADRISRYASLVGAENVIAGTDCGFATAANYLSVDPAIAWAKLEALCAGAELASRELF